MILLKDTILVLTHPPDCNGRVDVGINMPILNHNSVTITVTLHSSCVRTVHWHKYSFLVISFLFFVLGFDVSDSENL